MIPDFTKSPCGTEGGFHVNAQYERYFGDDINRRDYALIPVNTAQAYVNQQGYHSALSASVTQDFGEHVSVTATPRARLTQQLSVEKSQKSAARPTPTAGFRVNRLGCKRFSACSRARAMAEGDALKLQNIHATETAV